MLQILFFCGTKDACSSPPNTNHPLRDNDLDMTKIDWSEIDEQHDPKETEMFKRKNRKRVENNFKDDKDELSRKKKKSGKRFHRKKTMKDEPWIN